jgi:tetratricopeptide (TPR) repeat protein
MVSFGAGRRNATVAKGSPDFWLSDRFARVTRVTLTSHRANRGRPGRKPARAGGAGRLPSRVWLLWLVGILVVTFVAYLPSLNSDFTNWDDPLFVTKNPLLAHPSIAPVLTTPVAANYHPLTIWSLALNYRLSRLNPTSYHWLNLLLHLANTGLVFALIRRLTNNRFWTSVFTSLFFGIHPMHVESVAWVAERKDVLYALFYLLGLIAYLQYLDRRTIGWLGATFAAFVLSVASKPSAVVFPLTLAVIDFYRRRPFGARILLEKAPFLAVSLAAGILTLHAQRASGAIDPQRWGPSFQKVLIASYGTLMYAVKLVAPVHLSAVYPYPNPARPLGPVFYVAFGIVAVALPTIAYLCRRNRAVLFGLAFFFINIILVLQLFTVGGAVMADRYTYLPYLGLFFALTWMLDERQAQAPVAGTVKLVLTGGLLLMVPLSVVETWTRCKVWRDSDTLWSDIIRQYPQEIPDAYANRGWYYYEKAKRIDAAIADFDRAIALNPNHAKAWLNKGAVFSAQNQADSALVCFDRALRIEPNLFAAWSDRGGIRARKGDLSGAVADFSRSIALNPWYREAYSNRGLAYFMMKEYEKSIADSRRAIELDPDNRDTCRQLGLIGMALEELKRYREAIASFDEAIRRAPPGEPQLALFYLHRSYSRWGLGERTDASNDLREALRLGAKVDPAYIDQVAPGLQRP